MKRKILTIIATVLLGMFAVGGLSHAAALYPPPSVVTVNVNVAGDVNGNINIVVGNTITFSGDGFDALEGIGIDVFYSGPSGLRSTPALARSAAPTHAEDAADANGHFDHDLVLDQVGTATLLATGHSSGKTGSLTIHVLAVGSDGAAAGGAATGGSQSSGTGLARTGASLAGPLAIGFVALFAGLALLFFGTRGVRMRKSARVSG